MDVDANKRLVVRFYEEVWARGNVEFAEEVFADDYVRHDLRQTQAAPGAAGQARIAESFREAFPDLQWRVDLVLAEMTSSPLAGLLPAPTPAAGAISLRRASVRSSPA